MGDVIFDANRFQYNYQDFGDKGNCQRSFLMMKYPDRKTPFGTVEFMAAAEILKNSKQYKFDRSGAITEYIPVQAKAVFQTGSYNTQLDFAAMQKAYEQFRSAVKFG